jgi:hypothetical protein
MQSRWNDADARAAIETCGRLGIGADVALRIYTTRLPEATSAPMPGRRTHDPLRAAELR